MFTCRQKPLVAMQTSERNKIAVFCVIENNKMKKTKTRNLILRTPVL